MGAYQSRASTEKTTLTGASANGKYVWASSSMQGWRSTMEDSDIVVTDYLGDPDMCLFGVFDGHGGASVAACCQKYMASVLGSRPEFKSGDFPAALRAAFLHLDKQIRYPDGISTLEVLLRNAEESHEFTDMAPSQLPSAAADFSVSNVPLHELEKLPQMTSSAGSTAVVALVKDGMIICANAGDSRCVLSRKGVAFPLSDDHKPRNDLEYQRIIRAGGFVSVDNRVQGSLALSRALGDFDFKTHPSFPPEEQMVTALPDIQTEPISSETDEFLILACDGLFEVQSWQSLVTFVHDRLLRGMDIKQILEDALDASLGSIQGAQGSDNMTMQIILLPTAACKWLLTEGAINKEKERLRPPSVESPLDNHNLNHTSSIGSSSESEDTHATSDDSSSPSVTRSKRTLLEVSSSLE